MLTIEPPRFFVGIKQHRAFRINSKTILFVSGIVDAGPTQILRNAASVAPPVYETQLHQQFVSRCFGQHFIEVDEFLFVPLSWRPTKRMRARPVGEVGDWSNIARAALARCPN